MEIISYLNHLIIYLTGMIHTSDWLIRFYSWRKLPLYKLFILVLNSLWNMVCRYIYFLYFIIYNYNLKYHVIEYVILSHTDIALSNILVLTMQLSFINTLRQKQSALHWIETGLNCECSMAMWLVCSQIIL